MKKELEEKVENLVKSLYKSVKKAKIKDPIKDVLDQNRVAEVSPDSIKETGTGALNKKMKKCNDKEDCDCDCDREETGDMEKTELFVKNLMNNFQKISTAYLEKSAKMKKMGGPSLGSAISAGVQGSGSTPQGGIDAALGGATPPPAPPVDGGLEKAKIDEGMRATDKKKARAARKEGFTPNKRSSAKDVVDKKRIPNTKNKLSWKHDLEAKHGKKQSKEDLEYPMAASEGEKS